MKVLSHADLVNLVRNTEGTIHVGIGDDEYCCNPDVPVVEAPIDEAPIDESLAEDTADEAPVDPDEGTTEAPADSGGAPVDPPTE